MELLGGNIRYLRSLRKWKQEELGELVGVKKNTISNWENDASNPSLEQLLDLANIFQTDPGHLITRNYKEDGFIMGDQENRTLSPDNSNIFIPATVQAGYAMPNAPIFTNPIIVNIPGIKGEARTFEITGDSMMPLIFDGDYVVCRRLASAEDIEEHEVYVIATRRDGIMAKYLSVTENGLLCMSENSTYNPSFLIEFDEVIEIWIVKMLITGKFKRPSITPGGISLVKRLEILEEYMEDFLPDKDD